MAINNKMVSDNPHNPRRNVTKLVGTEELSIQEKKLKRSEDKGIYKALLESTGDGIIILDKNGKIIEINKKLADMSGYERSEVLGQNINSFIKMITPGRPQIIKQSIKKILSGLNTTQYEFGLIKKNGEVVSTEIKSRPLRKEDNGGNLVILRDVNERYKTELQIKTQKSLTARILRSIPASVVVVGIDQRIIIINKAFEHSFKLNQNNAVGKKVGDVVQSPTFIDAISRVLKDSKPQFQIEFRYKNGAVERIKIADVISTQQNEAMAIVIDITEEREMQERLYLTDRLASMGEMAAGIAHEINNPLTGVVALSQLLLESDVPSEIKDDLEAISSEGQRAANVVKNLLSFARGHTLIEEPIEINEIITQVLNLRAYEHRVDNIDVETNFAPDLPKIVVDRFQMQQVFLNIILNAEQAMIESHGHGKLNIRTEHDKEIIRIVFSDNGPGIASDIINRIFDPFFTTKTVGKGTGLGLSICYGIITKLGGKIYAQSPPVQGATFVIELPINNHDTRKR